MTNTMTKLVVNCETGDQQEVALTEEEVLQIEKDKADFLAQQAELEARIAEQNNLKQSAKNKLLSLGLSEEEVSAIISNS